MKKLINAIITVTVLTTSGVKAQDKNVLAVASERAPYVAPAPTVEAPKISETIKLQLYTATVRVNAADESITVNYHVPANANTARILIQDNNGRTLKDFPLVDKSKTSADFYINDLLEGTYKFTLLVNHEKVMAGNFELK